jgi:hypothetical protein
MAKPTISGRVPHDMKEEFDEYAERHEITKSVAHRRLIRAGLDAETDADQDEQSGGAGGMLERLASLRTVAHAVAFMILTALSWGMLALLPAAGTATVALLAATSGVTLLMALLALYAAVFAQQALNRPLTGLFSRGDVADV